MTSALEEPAVASRPNVLRGPRAEGGWLDDALSRLERAHAADPDDPTLAVELCRARLRAGRPLGALAVLGPLDPREREAAGEALAQALGLEWRGVVDGVDRFGHVPGSALHLVLVHAGAFLDDGEGFLASSLLQRQERADLRRVVVPALLAESGAREQLCGTVRDDPFGARGGRLPRAGEWKKLWRGGLFLDGDASARVPNPDPDRLLPQGVADEPGVRARSPYGAEFDLRACEVLHDGRGGVFDEGSARYLIPTARSSARRQVCRMVRELPGHLA